MNTMQTKGTVTRTDDPAKAGRIKFTLAELSGSEVPDWVEASLPPGLFMLPRVGDVVYVNMPDDDDLVEFPEEIRWTGVVRDDGTPWPGDFTKEYGRQFGVKTLDGHILFFDDKGKEIRLVNLDTKSSLVLAESGNATINAGTLAKIAAPATELSTDATEFILKGNTVINAVTAYTQTVATAYTTWQAVVPPTPVSNGAFLAAIGLATATLATSLSTWASTKVKTG